MKQLSAAPMHEMDKTIRVGHLSLRWPRSSSPTTEEALQIKHTVSLKGRLLTDISMNTYFIITTSKVPLVCDKPKSVAYEGR